MCTPSAFLNPWHGCVPSWRRCKTMVAALRTLLSVTLSAAGAHELDLRQRKYGIFVAELKGNAKDAARLVLQVQAQLPSEAVHTRLPQMVKVGPIEAIRELVNMQLPGIGLKALPVAPRELPYVAGAAYFELQVVGSPLWQQARSSGHLALHVAGEFPNLALALWQIA